MPPLGARTEPSRAPLRARGGVVPRRHRRVDSGARPTLTDPRAMAYDFLTFDVADRIATITVNRPDKLNALNDATIVELGKAIEETRSRDDVGAVILTGAGRAFIAGADISELSSQTPVTAKARAQRGQAIFRRFETSPKPT